MSRATSMLHRSAAQAPRTDARVPVLPRPEPGFVLQRRCACGGAAPAGGECEDCRRKRDRSLQRWPASHGTEGVRDFSRVPTQTPLSIVSKDDPSEREAEKIADAVVLSNTSPAVLNAWTDLQVQHLGGTTPAHRQPAQTAFQAVRTRMRRPISVVCHPGAEARCRPGTTLFTDGETVHLCPMWSRLPAPQARLNLLLSRVYEAMGGVPTSFNAQRDAQLAIALTDRFNPVPARAAILNPPAPAAAPANAGQP